MKDNVGQRAPAHRSPRQDPCFDPLIRSPVSRDSRAAASGSFLDWKGLSPDPARIEVPTACAAFPGEFRFTPRRWLEARYNLVRFTMMPSGGHFAASEAPELLVDDLRAFFRDLR